jgi:hypothetical protein
VDVSVRESLEWSPRYDLMNAAEYKKYNDMAYDEGIKEGVWDANRGKQKHWGYDTDWQDEVLSTALARDADFNNFVLGKHHRLPIPQVEVDNSAGQLTQNSGAIDSQSKGARLALLLCSLFSRRSCKMPCAKESIWQENARI